MSFSMNEFNVSYVFQELSLQYFIKRNISVIVLLKEDELSMSK